MKLRICFSDNPTRSNHLDKSTNENIALDQIIPVSEGESEIPLSEGAPNSDMPSSEGD